MPIIAGWGRGTWGQGSWGQPLQAGWGRGTWGQGPWGQPLSQTGWGRGFWGQGPWGQPISSGSTSVDVQPTGVAATSAVGSVSVSVVASEIVQPTGVSATSAVGTILADAGAIILPTGVAGSTGIGNESVVGTALVDSSGVSSTVSISGYSATTITKTVLVQNVSGANKYFIDGVQQQTQELFERNTYRFDQSDSSNSNHPLRFSTTSNGSHAGGSEYTTGVTVNGTPGQAVHTDNCARVCSNFILLLYKS